MKLLQLIAMTLALTSGGIAHANHHEPGGGQPGHDPGQCWEHIKKHGNLIPQFPSIQFDGSFLTVDELCVAGDQLMAKNHFRKRCVEFASDESGSCTRYELVHYVTPITYTAHRCVQYNNDEAMTCAQYEAYTVDHPLKYNVTVSRVDHEGTLTPLFEKPFEIPACQ